MKKIITFSVIGLVSLSAILNVKAEEKMTVTKNHNVRFEEKVKVIDEMVENNELTKEKAEEIKKELSQCGGKKRKFGKKHNLQFGKKLGKGQENGIKNHTRNCDGSCQKNN